MEPTLEPKSGFLALRRLKIELTYEGTNYAGWAFQPDQRTLQGEIESAISKIARTKVETIVAGRTDAGVHARQQFIHVDIPQNPLPPDITWDIPNWAYKLNRILDEDIRILKVEDAPPGFHARFSPTERRYEYKIADDLQIVKPLERFDVEPWYRKLDIDLMNEAGNYLLGEHDFKAFCKFREDQTTIRTLMKFHWRRAENGFLIADVRANAFCYSMVRNLVGAAVCVGEGRFPKEWVLEVLANKERVSDSYVFPGRGLTLTEIVLP